MSNKMLYIIIALLAVGLVARTCQVRLMEADRKHDQKTIDCIDNCMKPKVEPQPQQ
jgi:hypothetical protein